MGPFAALRYLYVGSADVARDVAWYTSVLGATVVWDFEAFGTRVAAVDVGGPLVLLAGHRPAPSVLPVHAVADLEATAQALRERGWTAKEGPFGLPDGTAYLYEDPSGNEWCFFEEERPSALVGRYAEAVAAGEEGAVPHPEAEGAAVPSEAGRGRRSATGA